VTTLEDRLRDAYRGAAATIRPGTIRGLGDHSLRVTGPAQRRPSRRRRILIPLAAAAAVAVVAVAAAVVIPLARSGQPPAPVASAVRYPKFFVAQTGNGTLTVRSATTGAFVARVRPPRVVGGVSAPATGNGRTLTVRRARTGACRRWRRTRHRAQHATSLPCRFVALPRPTGATFSALATGYGRTFVVGVPGLAGCATYFYQFGLTRSGMPTALTPFAVPKLRQLVQEIAVSANGRTFGYYTEPCTGTPVAYLAVTNLATGRARRWSLPHQADIGPLSLTASGHLLAYNIQQTKLFPSVARVLPTDAAPGTAAQRSRTVARASRFGRSDDIYADAITPDGRALYFTTNVTGVAVGHGATWKLRVANVATGRSRIVAAFPGLAMGFTQDPSGRYLLLESELGPQLATPRLTRLDLATRQVGYLHAAWIGPDYSAGFAW
jgi:hypothetical protein